MPSDRPVVSGIQHVGMPFPGTPESVAEARRFYHEILGLAELAVPPALPGVIVWLAVGDQEIHLFTEPSGVAVNDQSRRHPCLLVDDVERLREHLALAGVTTIDDDGVIPGRPRFFALDPFGNRIEFVHFEADHW